MSLNPAVAIPRREQSEVSFFSTDKPHGLVMAAQMLVGHLAKGRVINAPILRTAMEDAFGATDVEGAWSWGAKGAERIAACWAANRKVTQVAFKPDWIRNKNAAPFKRNDALLEALPIGVIVFPGSGIVENLADKARRMGIPVWRFGEERS
jgi:hypothetical protein